MSDANSPQDWNALAERVACHVDNYLNGLEAVARGDGGKHTIPLLLLEVSQVILAGAQLGASADVILPDNWEPEVGDDPDLDAVRQGLRERLQALDEYVEVFDPYKDTEPTAYRLSDDLVDVASDLVHGLRHYNQDRPLEALWWWQYSYFNHWGNHAGAALRALHAFVANSRLDVSPEVATA
ncbi:DUF5063 domain-containing protein [Actinomadura madurae]|uniref:DUF5063 domain-containing protein n=1 Tax=Actinomadura madurae TaxID=1993 RepID=UPI00202695AF|nr:DUF5063 domain-containing protein [Actinomadura madurae]MCP9952281.1 DUF5063 domain-containing protein [Actinomadura madurae]MCP9969047.1 DUF5063 domain-containing protein [Actinomadura madurae]MCP9981514.1 DUF5063 domain-containing protein [Actinomadura madurae]MCQ0017717.1 DUF5063 domain-containing protein [Actinomadura madurae]URN08498.1 DUF5063 domain-containing protein [Actinomadura madurae]